MNVIQQAMQENQALHARLDGDGMVKAEEQEEVRRRQQTHIAELEQELEQLRSKSSTLEKQKSRMQAEVRTNFNQFSLGTR